MGGPEVERDAEREHAHEDIGHATRNDATQTHAVRPCPSMYQLPLGGATLTSVVGTNLCKQRLEVGGAKKLLERSGFGRPKRRQEPPDSAAETA